MLVAYIILVLLFLLLSILSFMGKLMLFIAGKGSDDAETSYDSKSAGNFIGIIMMMLTISSCVGMLGFALEKMRWLILASPVCFILLLIFAIIFINTNNRFETGKNEREEDKE